MTQTDDPADGDLETYLATHLSGGDGGLALARRILADHGTGPYGPRLRSVAGEIEEDHETLRGMMGALDADRGVLLRLGGLGAAAAAHLQPHGALIRHKKLGLVLRLEALGAGVRSKGRLWAALLAVADGVPALDEELLRALAGRAAAQLEVIDQVHVEAARAALAKGSAPGS